MNQFYFLRYGLTVPLRINGKVVKFEDFGDDVGGVIIPEAPEFASYISELRSLASRKLGGIRETDLDGYEDAKKAASVEQQRRHLLDARLHGTQFSTTPRLAGPAGSKAVTAHVPGVSIGVTPIIPEITLVEPSSGDAGRILIPDQVADPGSGMIHRSTVSYPAPMSNEEYAKIFASSKVPEEAPAAAAAAPAKAPEPPRVGKRKGG